MNPIRLVVGLMLFILAIILRAFPTNIAASLDAIFIASAIMLAAGLCLMATALDDSFRK